MQEKNENSQNRPGGPASPSQGGLSWSTPQHQTPKPVQQTKPIVPSAPQNSNAAKYAGMVVIGIVAGVILAWGWVSWRPSSSATNGTATTTSNGSTATGGNLGVDTSSLPTIGSNAALDITSPQAAGNSVAVAKAVVSTPTWIVIYENKNGKPGNALGAALFFPESQTGTVELLRATMPGKTYLAAEQVDNGDRRFSLKDDQFLAEGGQVQWVTFETN